MQLAEFWEKVVLLCKEFDASVTSGPRSSKRNQAVGGAPLSWHVYGLAADLVPDEVSRKPQLIERAKRLFPFVLDEGDHVHVQGET